ncbi:unnamed protein product, partial [Discosporangium mesarthrocarpum]
MATPIFTARTGNATARSDHNSPGTTSRKRALKPTFFSKDHFSSSLADNDDPMRKRTRVVVKLLEGKNLLVSDLLTGTSDPVCFVWVDSHNDDDMAIERDGRIQATEVCKHTVDPVWDTEFIFPLSVKSVEDIMAGQVNIAIRDKDDEDGTTHYDELGKVLVPLEVVLTEGRPMAHTQLVQLPARWYAVQKWRGMRKVTGALKIAVGLFIGEDTGLLGVAEGDEETRGTDKGFQGLFQRNRGREMGHGWQGGRGALSTSPSWRHSTSPNRILTARGGTVSQRPKSAPMVTTLTSPTRSAQKPFAFNPFRRPTNSPAPRCSWEGDAGLNGPATALTGGGFAVVGETEGDGRGAQGFPDTSNQPVSLTPPDSLDFLGSPPPQFQWGVSQGVNGLGPVRASGKLTKLAAKASASVVGRGEREWGPWDSGKGHTVERSSPAEPSRRWKMGLLVSMQRLEERSTERMAYGELWALFRAAQSPQQVVQFVSEARKVSTSSPLSARSIVLRLLARLCWEQPQVMSKASGAVVGYLVERIHDKESASLRKDLAACTGAVMLSALRGSSPDATMEHVKRLLSLAREQRGSVRESTGVCLAATVLPPPPPVLVEIETGHSGVGIDEVRLSIRQALHGLGIDIPSPKDIVLFPGGRVVMEMLDIRAATDFHDALLVATGHLPPKWRICPFPEDLCDVISQAVSAYVARFTIISEEFLASLLEALGSPRTQGTRGPLLDAVANMAQVCASSGSTEGKGDPTSPSPSPSLSAVGLSSTLAKGLPAIVQQLQSTLEGGSGRKAHTWKERVAALGAIAALAELRVLEGPGGPLGEHHQRLSASVLTAGHDTVKAVREASVRALKALKAVAIGGGAGRGGAGGGDGLGASRKPRVSIASLRRRLRERANKAGGQGTGTGKNSGKGTGIGTGGEVNLDQVKHEGKGNGLKKKVDMGKFRFLPLSEKNGNRGWSRDGGGTMGLSKMTGAQQRGSSTTTKAEMQEEEGEAELGGIEGGQGSWDDCVEIKKEAPIGRGEELLMGTGPGTGDRKAPSPVHVMGEEAPELTEQTSPGMHGAQVDTVRFLRQLGVKTDTIANTITSLDERLVGIEKTLEVGQEVVCISTRGVRMDAGEGKGKTAAGGRGEGDSATGGVRTGKNTLEDPHRHDHHPADTVARARAGAGHHTRLNRELLHLVRKGDTERAFRMALDSGRERDMLRVMGRAGGPGACLRCGLGMETRARLFSFISRAISASLYTEHVLPWVFELAQRGEASLLPCDVRVELGSALHGLAAVPTDVGVMAARLGPYVS